MSYRISNIEISNFKSFNGTFKLFLNRNNLLLFGENGTGKSSVYWSLYTHFQAHLKKNAVEAQKYFSYGNSESLRNRYSASSDISGITITFTDENKSSIIVQDSQIALSVSTPAIFDFMRKTTEASDFLNYKFLSSLYDSAKEKEYDIFNDFKKEVFPFIYFTKPLVDINGVSTGRRDALFWWEYIESTVSSLPKNKINTFNQRTGEYLNFVSIIKSFNEELDKVLVSLEISANNIIKDFAINSRISLNFTSASFNNRIAKRKYDQSVTPPKIILKAQMMDPAIRDNSPIIKLQSFYNEAKLTCMSLAIRLAILNTRPAQGPDYASVLVVDDLLISLDMGLRMQVVKYLLEYSKNRQMLIFTHDRALFHYICSVLEHNDEKNSWQCLEMYIPDGVASNMPRTVLWSDHIETAKMHLSRNEIQGCANALRRACEKILKGLLSENKVLKLDVPEGGYNGIQDLKILIDHFSKLKKECGMPNIAPNLDNERQLILNPFSHDDMNTPFYRNELQSLIDQLEDMTSIKKKILVNSNNLRNTKYKCVVKNGSHTAFAEFVYLDRYERYDYKGNSYYSCPGIVVLNTSSKDVKNKCYQKIDSIFNRLLHDVSLNTTSGISIKDCIFDCNGKYVR